MFFQAKKPPTSKHPSLGIKLKIEPKGEGFGTSVVFVFFHQGKTFPLISWDPWTKTHQRVLETHQNSENWAPNQAKLDILKGWRGATLIKIASGIPSCTTWRSWTWQKIRYLPYLKRAWSLSRQRFSANILLTITQYAYWGAWHSIRVCWFCVRCHLVWNLPPKKSQDSISPWLIKFTWAKWVWDAPLQPFQSLEKGYIPRKNMETKKTTPQESSRTSIVSSVFEARLDPCGTCT